MATFPENEVQIFPDRPPPKEIKGIRAELLRISFRAQIDPNFRNNKHAHDVNEARRTIAFSLGDPSVSRLPEAEFALWEHLNRREFGLADDAITNLERLKSPRPRLTAHMIRLAKSELPIDFEIREIIEHVPGEPDVVIKDATLAGYAGPRLTEAQIARLVRAQKFLTRGAERDFLLTLWRAERHFGLRGTADLPNAIRLYAGLLPAAVMTPREVLGVQLDLFERFVPADLPTQPTGLILPHLPDLPGQVDEQIVVSLLTPRQRFVAMRSASAHLALADLFFRKERAHSDDSREGIVSVYGAALQLVRRSGISPENPVRQAIETHALQQITRLDSRLNFMGLWDGFVPVQRFTVLRDLASQQIQAARDSAQEFKTFLEGAEALIGEELDLQAEITAEAANKTITILQQQNASLSVDKIDRQIALIASQQDFLGPQTLATAFRVTVESLSKGGAGPLGAVAGLAETGVNFLAQRDELGHQKRMAEIERAIAGNQSKIVDVQAELSLARLAYLDQKLQLLEGKRLNADLLYALAEIAERRAERQLDVAIFLAYLFERALAFFLGKPMIDHVQFDYLDRVGIFTAASGLDGDFLLVAAEMADLEQEKFDFFQDGISLRGSYPLEFARFLQTGEMEFVYSLYQLSKLRPATHQCRLREVGVEVRGLVPPTGFSGTLTHMGRFLVRDKAATLEAETQRLVPTEEELEQAFEEQQGQGSPVAAVSGVLYYSLVPDTKELSLNTQFVSPAPEEFTLDIFEGYGPAALWRLEIQNLDQLDITDIVLHFAMVSRKSDPFDLQPKVEQLIRSFEIELTEGDRLDRISRFSLREQFPDVFFALGDGSATFDLDDQNFPSGLTNLQFKAVIALAVDQDEKGMPGVGLEFRRPDVGFNRARITGLDGFSEDLDGPAPVLDPDERFPVVGAWEINLSEPAQFSQLGDLEVFLMYTFEEP